MENKGTKDVTALEEDYRARTPRSQELFERARKTMPGGAKGAYFHQPYPLTMARGEGCYLHTMSKGSNMWILPTITRHRCWVTITRRS